jgi:hypothetical protein
MFALMPIRSNPFIKSKEKARFVASMQRNVQNKIQLDTEIKKDWVGNKMSTITTSGFHNNSTHEREANDFYATSPIALEKLLEKDRKLRAGRYGGNCSRKLEK